MNVKKFLETDFFYPTEDAASHITKLNKLIHCWEIIVLHRTTYMKLINTLCGRNSEFLNVNPLSILGFKFQVFPRKNGF